MSESYTAVGMVEFNSIAAGIDAADQMVKTAQVDPLFFKTICPGKFVAAVTGDVAAVSASVNAGRETHADALVDWFIIPNIHRDVIGALAVPRASRNAARSASSKPSPPPPSWWRPMPPSRLPTCSSLTSAWPSDSAARAMPS